MTTTKKSPSEPSKPKLTPHIKHTPDPTLPEPKKEMKRETRDCLSKFFYESTPLSASVKLSSSHQRDGGDLTGHLESNRAGNRVRASTGGGSSRSFEGTGCGDCATTIAVGGDCKVGMLVLIPTHRLIQRVSNESFKGKKRYVEGRGYALEQEA
jgi:hypothetical protein